MGNFFNKESSSSINIPTYKRYNISYVKLQNINELKSNRSEMDLSNLIKDNDNQNNLINLIYGSLFYKLNTLGIWFNPIIPDIEFSRETPLNNILETIKQKGFLLKDDNSSETVNLLFELNAYYPTIENIKNLINNSNILIAGILLDNELINNLITNNLTEQNEASEIIDNNSIYSDIILIVGYNDSGLIIKTVWYSDSRNIVLDYKFLNNIKEIWNINININ